jgi:hypothetical protein
MNGLRTTSPQFSISPFGRNGLLVRMGQAAFGRYGLRALPCQGISPEGDNKKILLSGRGSPEGVRAC